MLITDLENPNTEAKYSYPYHLMQHSLHVTFQGVCQPYESGYYALNASITFTLALVREDIHWPIS